MIELIRAAFNSRILRHIGEKISAIVSCERGVPLITKPKHMPGLVAITLIVILRISSEPIG